MSDGPFATGTLPWNLTADDGGPRRGSLADYGNATVEDEDTAPDKDTMLYADLCNGLQRAAAAHDRAVFAVGFTVTVPAGTPVLSQVTGPGDVTLDLLNFTLTPNGAGDFSITWPANSFPAAILGPTASLNDDTVGGGINPRLITNGVRVLTWTGASTAAYRACTVTVH